MPATRSTPPPAGDDEPQGPTLPQYLAATAVASVIKSAFADAESGQREAATRKFADAYEDSTDGRELIGVRVPGIEDKVCDARLGVPKGHAEVTDRQAYFNHVHQGTPEKTQFEFHVLIPGGFGADALVAELLALIEKYEADALEVLRQGWQVNPAHEGKQLAKLRKPDVDPETGKLGQLVTDEGEILPGVEWREGGRPREFRLINWVPGGKQAVLKLALSNAAGALAGNLALEAEAVIPEAAGDVIPGETVDQDEAAA